MKTGAQDKKKLTTAIVAGVAALGALVFLYSELFGGPSTPPPAAPVIINATAPRAGVQAGPPGRTVASPPGAVVNGSAKKLGTTSGQLDPTLHMEAMLVTESLVYTGSGRNIFAAGSTAPVQPKVLEVKNNFPPRPPTQAPLPPQQTGPPPLPPIDLKFFGTSTDALGKRQAFLLKGDEVFLASTGDIVKCTSVSVAMPNTIDLVPPATPASVPADSTKAISL